MKIECNKLEMRTDKIVIYTPIVIIIVLLIVYLTINITIQDFILNVFYISSIFGIGFLAFYSITVYRDFQFKITPRVNAYFENPKFMTERDIFHIHLVIRNEGDVAVQNVNIKFEKKDVFFDEEYSQMIFKNGLFKEGVNLSPHSTFQIPVISTKEVTVHELNNKKYSGSKFFRSKNEKIYATLSYFYHNVEFKRRVELTLYQLFYTETGKTFHENITDINNTFKEVLKKL